MSDILVTLCNPQTGQSESIPVAPSLTLTELIEWSKALLGMDGNLMLMKDGHPLRNPSLSLNQAGVANGDLLVVMKPAARPAPAAASGGGIDFSNLLGGGTSSPAPAAAGGLNFSNLLASAGANNGNPTPVFYQGMPLADAVDANPHPKAIVKLLQEQEGLFNQLNYHNPVLAQKMRGLPYEKAVQTWRESVVKGSIQSANAHTQTFHKQREFTRRLAENPEDKEAKEYFGNKKKKELVWQQYQQAMQEYPESMGRVLMLYVDAKINGNPIQAFVDSGAQTTIMSKKIAQECGLFDLVDTRFAGVAVGVGTGKILGRIHIVQLQIGDAFFPCSVTIMDSSTMPMAGGGEETKGKDMEFLLGLDMLKRHTCSIDLEQGKLKFRLAPGQYLETPFLHEKDLDESKGGTKGFDAEKSNEELLKAQEKYEKEGNKGGDDDDKMEE